MKKTEKILKSELVKIKSIRKRSGEVVSFDLKIIARAVSKAFEVTDEGGETESYLVANSVFKTILGLREELVKNLVSISPVLIRNIFSISFIRDGFRN